MTNDDCYNVFLKDAVRTVAEEIYASGAAASVFTEIVDGIRYRVLAISDTATSEDIARLLNL